MVGMGGRYASGGEDYPEHLNPFREDTDGDDLKKNKLTALGRRKLRAVLNLTSWTLFPWRKSKPTENGSSELNTSGRNRFLTMTPKLSRHLIERLSKRKPRSASLAPASNPGTSTGQSFSYAEFRIMPKSSREKFAVRSPREKQEDVLEGSYLWADRTSAPDLTLSSTSTSPRSEVCGDDDLHGTEPRYTKQGAKPRKKRPAPLPPSSVLGTPADHKHVNTTTETGEKLTLPTPPSPLSKNIDVSLHESPPRSPNSNSSSVCEMPTNSNITSALVHEPSPTSNHINVSTLETSVTSNTSVLVNETSRNESFHVSTQEASITSNNIDDSTHEKSVTSNISVLVHENSPNDSVHVSTQEVSITSNNIDDSTHEKSVTSNILVHENSPNDSVHVSTQEASITSSNIDDSTHETLVTSNISVLVDETSPNENVKVSTHEASITTNNIGDSTHETSVTSNSCVLIHETSPNESVQVSTHEKSITSNNIGDSTHKASVTPNSSPTENSCVSLQEATETSPNSNEVNVSVHETSLLNSSNLTPSEGDDQKELNPAICKL